MQKQKFQLEDGDTPSLGADDASSAYFGNVNCKMYSWVMFQNAGEEHDD